MLLLRNYWWCNLTICSWFKFHNDMRFILLNMYLCLSRLSLFLGWLRVHRISCNFLFESVGSNFTFFFRSRLFFEFNTNRFGFRFFLHQLKKNLNTLILINFSIINSWRRCKNDGTFILRMLTFIKSNCLFSSFEKACSECQ